MGYRCEPALTAEGFTDAGFEMPDIGSVGPDGHVTVLGRADDVVVVKGVNVSPDAVGRIAADLPDVVAAAAVGVHPRGGDPSICVFVEVRDAAHSLSSSMQFIIGANTALAQSSKSSSSGSSMPRRASR